MNKPVIFVNINDKNDTILFGSKADAIKVICKRNKAYISDLVLTTLNIPHNGKIYKADYWLNNKGKIRTKYLKKDIDFTVNKTGSKKEATQLLNKAVEIGLIIRPKKCFKCNRENIRIVGHHEDYNKPLDVDWICCRCHYYMHN